MLLFYLSLADSPTDRQKIERLYYEYRSFMMAITMNILKNRELAEDAVHDSILKIIDNIDRIDEIKDQRTKAFIYIITVNTAKTKLIKEKKTAAVDFELAEKITVSESDTFQSVFVKELLQKISELPAIYRDPLQLSVYYGMSTREIAKLLDITAGLVNKRILRARAMLKEKIESEAVK